MAMRLLRRKLKSQITADESLSRLKDVQFNFRDGFSSRLSARLENILANDPSTGFIINLSSLLPRLLVISSIAILLFTLTMIFINGDLNMEAFVGSHKVDENNFIGYLILE